jgi:hypothetical protein
MAGSYKHIVDENGNFRLSTLDGVYKDTAEALEECFFLINYLAKNQQQIDKALKEFYTLSRNELCIDKRAKIAFRKSVWRQAPEQGGG